MDNLALYRVEERATDGWKMGMCVWMKPQHFRSFLDYIEAPHIRVRREATYNCNRDPRIWNGPGNNCCPPYKT